MLKPITKLRQSIVKRIYRQPPVARFLARQFFRSFFYSKHATWMNTHWMGAPVVKSPLDMWVYQEILFAVKPDIIIECGTNRGGSAYYLGAVCDLIGKGKILTIDIEDLIAQGSHPRHERATYVIGSSTSDETVQKVRNFAAGAETVLVVLDSDHTRDHVLNEMRIYGEMVTRGSYMIVEDSCLNGNPINPASGPGPAEAIELYLRETDAFVTDSSREKYFMTFNPGGFLERVK